MRLRSNTRRAPKKALPDDAVSQLESVPESEEQPSSIRSQAYEGLFVMLLAVMLMSAFWMAEQLNNAEVSKVPSTPPSRQLSIVEMVLNMAGSLYPRGG